MTVPGIRGRAPVAVTLLAAALIAATLVAPVAPPSVSTAHLPSLATANLGAARWALESGSAPSVLRGPSASGAAAGLNPYFWTNISGAIGRTAPPPVLYAQMTWDAADGYVLLFGGELTTGQLLNQTWSYLNGTWTNLTGTVTGTPPALIAAGMAYDPSTQSVILFGGENSVLSGENYTWAYHDLTWTNLTATVGPAPSARAFASAATDSTDDELLLFGGVSPDGALLTDTWTFHDDAWTNVTATSGFNAFAVLPTLCDDPAAGGVLLTGVATNLSTHEVPALPITFVYSGSTWHNLSATNALAPMTFGELPPAIGFLPYGQDVELFSAAVITTNGDLVLYPVEWTFSNSVWTNITGQRTTPGGIVLAPSAADPLDSTLVLFSGERVVAGVTVNDTWLLSAPPVVRASASRSVIDAGQTVSFTGDVSAGAGPNAPDWSFGDGGSSSVLSPTHTFHQAGIYSVNLTISDLVGESGTAATAVYVNPSPAVSITVGPASPTAGSAAEFVATVSGGTAPFTYTWSLGDGATASSMSVAHSYASSGSYAVTVTVVDAAGESVHANLTVSVGAAVTPFSYTSGPGLALLALVIVFAAIAAVLALLYARGRRRERPPPAPYAPSAGAATPPPGARGPVGPVGGGPPPPWSEGPPPPGAPPV
ncbi:MAG TPA: PKD domain-containing protein [Thermoplasmata archaeon]|nr:PKD domain-containing protein [Thermoplasmata archaeon]